MSTWSDKNIRFLDAIRQRFEGFMRRKGQQMYAGSAAMLWYVRASPEVRTLYENRVREIEEGLCTVDDPIGGVDKKEVAHISAAPRAFTIEVRNVLRLLDSRVRDMEVELNRVRSPEEIEEFSLGLVKLDELVESVMVPQEAAKYLSAAISEAAEGQAKVTRKVNTKVNTKVHGSPAKKRKPKKKSDDQAT